MIRHRAIRNPRALGCALALLFVILAFTAGMGGAKATPAAVDLVWVRQEPAVVNANGDPLEYIAPDPRFEGTFDLYDVSETAISLETRYVDHGYEYYHVWLDSVFDRPPLVLNAPLRYKITAEFSHGGTVKEGADGVGAQLWYSSDYAAIEPREVLAYYPWHPAFPGISRKEWMIEAPPISQEGQTFEVYAGWWNCAPCNVTWTYKAEPANAVEQLAVEVGAPVVTYQGEEVPPGEVFFPETCDLPLNRSPVGCKNQVELDDRARLELKCARLEGIGKLLLIVDLLDLEDDNAVAYWWSVYFRMAEECGLASARADADFQLGLFLAQGGLLLTNAVAGQTVDIATPLARVTTTYPGAFVAGYDPDSDIAIFQSYSAPLTVRPASGAPLVLQPRQQVEVTAAGTGPVTGLPHVFLPLQIR